MARIITKELALKIVKKLDAQLMKSKRGAHEVYGVRHGARVIAQISIRRGSEKDAGHDFVSKLLHLSPHEARLLAQCSLSRDDWLQILRQKGVLPPEPSKEQGN